MHTPAPSDPSPATTCSAQVRFAWPLSWGRRPFLTRKSEIRAGSAAALTDPDIPLETLSRRSVRRVQHLLRVMRGELEAPRDVRRGGTLRRLSGGIAPDCVWQHGS